MFASRRTRTAPGGARQCRSGYQPWPLGNRRRPEHERARRPVAGARIVLVDNDTEATASFAALLALEQASVQVASSAELALELLAKGTVDALMADIQLPGIDGY